MSSIADSAVSIQTSTQSIPSTPSWFGEVALIAHYLRHQGVLSALEKHVRFARRRFGHYDLIDFVAVLLGYAVSGERTLETFYERLLPFAAAFMGLFGRDRLPHRSTLSRFLSSLDQATVEALRTLFLKDLLARPLGSSEKPGGLWDREGTCWLVFDVDGTRQAARQRALPHTPDLPPAQRRLREVCAPGYLGRKRGEVVRTRTTVLQAHTHQWLATFGGAGNGDYRGELRRAVETIQTYLCAQGRKPAEAVIRLDGHYGNGAVVADLGDLPYVMRGRDYQVLDRAEVQARLQLPPDQQTIHPESGTTRLLYDCPDLVITPTGKRGRVVIATHPAGAAKSRVGSTREGVVYELFFTALPQGAFTAADVVALYLHRGAFETVLADEDLEQDPDRWCSHSPWGQEFWQLISQWVWNLRLELGHQLHPAPLRTTEFAEAHASSPQVTKSPMPVLPSSGTPTVVRTARMGCLPGSEFPLQADGTLRCPAGHPLFEQERRQERDDTLRIVYAASIGHCRPCPLRERCQGYGAATSKPRRVSAILRLSAEPTRSQEVRTPKTGTAPVLWRDWSRCQTRREWMRLLRSQRVDLLVGPEPVASLPKRPKLLSRAQRAHWRMSWQERLARNARAPTAPAVTISLYGLPPAFAASLGLATV